VEVSNLKIKQKACKKVCKKKAMANIITAYQNIMQVESEESEKKQHK